MKLSWLTGRVRLKCVLACELIVVVLLAQQLARLSWMLIPAATDSPLPWKPEVLEKSAAQSAESFPSLQQLHLFGVAEAPKKNSPPSINPDQVPRSRLSVRIAGIVASNDARQSLAIIRFGSEDKTYRIGDSIQGTGAELVDIYPDRVIVLNAGKPEALLLYPNDRKRRTAPRPVAAPERVAGKLPLARLADNPASVLELIRIDPVFREGQLLGYRLNPKSNPELFNQAGLKKDDIALSINGYDLTRQGEAMKLLQELPRLDRISVTVERNGQIYQLELSS